MFSFCVRCQNTVIHQKLYDISQIPIVDMHTHLNGKEDFRYAVNIMNEWGGTISVSVNSNDNKLMQFIKDSLNSRILLCQRGDKYTAEEVVEMKKKNYSGLRHGFNIRNHQQFFHLNR